MNANDIKNYIIKHLEKLNDIKFNFENTDDESKYQIEVTHNTLTNASANEFTLTIRTPKNESKEIADKNTKKIADKLNNDYFIIFIDSQEIGNSYYEYKYTLKVPDNGDRLKAIQRGEQRYLSNIINKKEKDN